MAQLTKEIINAAIEGFEAQKRRLDDQIAELRSMLNGSPRSNTTSNAPTNRKGRTMSAEGRARIAEAQRKRWAAAKGEEASTQSAPSKRKRKLSPEGRAAIVAALKKRWAAKKAGATSPKKVTAKKAEPAKRTAKVAKRGTAKKAAPAAAPTAA